MKKSFRFLSGDGVTKIHGVQWIPASGRINAILQISHGMVEYVERYDEFAHYMNQKGILVVGHDHLGHGKSVLSENEWGYFSKKFSDEILIRDMHKLRKTIQKKYSAVPYFMLGHSMGSFILRKYLSRHGENLHGAVILGTGIRGRLELLAGMLLCSSIAAVKGWKYRSALVHRLAFQGNQKSLKKEGGNTSWLTKDTKIAAAYANDPRCTFRFTLNGYFTLFSLFLYSNRYKNIQRIPKELPILLSSGAEDPLGNYGKGIKKLYHIYRKAGIKEITYRLYKDDRHEIINELDRETVYADIHSWIAKRTG